jgi:hypothetical protein
MGRKTRARGLIGQGVVAAIAAPFVIAEIVQGYDAAAVLTVAIAGLLMVGLRGVAPRQ